MSQASKRIEKFPFLHLLEPGSTEADGAPSLDDAGRPQIRSSETVLEQLKIFPIFRPIGSSGRESLDVSVPGDGGVTWITDQRVIFVREKYDVGTFGTSVRSPVLRAASRTLASARRGDTVAAGHIEFESIIDFSRKLRKQLIGTVEILKFVAAIADGLYSVELRFSLKGDDLHSNVVAAISHARNMATPAPQILDKAQVWTFVTI